MNMRDNGIQWDAVLALRKALYEAYGMGSEAEVYRLSAMIDAIQIRLWTARYESNRLT